MSSQPSYKKCTLEFDGSSKGNPGIAGAGAVLRSEDGHVIARAREGLGKATNNAAAYHGLRLGLDLAIREGCTDITVKTDSKLVVNQVQGYWKINNPILRILCNEAIERAKKFQSFEISHFDKGSNSAADTQANMGAALRYGEVHYDRGDNFSENEDNSMHECESPEDGDKCELEDSDSEHGDDYYEDKDDSVNNVAEYSADDENSVDGNLIEHEDGNSKPGDYFLEDSSIQGVVYSHEQQDGTSSESVDNYFPDTDDDTADYSTGSNDGED